jgi:hypothetical protein
MSVPDARGKIAKGETERRLIAAIPKGHRLVRANWSKRNFHIADGFGRVRVIHISDRI